MIHEYHAEFAGGYRATLKISTNVADVSWSPDLPKFKGQRRRKFLAAYRTWRDTSLADFASRAGIRIALVEL